MHGLGSATGGRSLSYPIRYDLSVVSSWYDFIQYPYSGWVWGEKGRKERERGNEMERNRRRDRRVVVLAKSMSSGYKRQTALHI